MNLTWTKRLGVMRAAMVVGLAMATLAVVDGSNGARAGGFVGTCANADPASGGATQVLGTSTTNNLTAAAGDVVTITPTGAPFGVTFGATTIVPTMTVTTTTFTVKAGQDGVYVITVGAGAAPTLTCTVGGAGQGVDAQQRSLSNIVVTSQTNNVVNQVFDNLGNSFASNGTAAGPQVAANGFSINSRGLAGWLNEKEKARIERQIAELPKSEQGTLGVTPVAAIYPARTSLWNGWIRGAWTYYDGDGSSFDGHTIDLTGGIDYRFTSDVVAGVMVGYGNADFDTSIAGVGGSFDADGYTVGPYVGIKLSEHVQLDAMLAYTYSDYDTSSGATTGDFGADRITGAVQITGRWTEGNWFYEPSVRFVYAEEDQHAYTDSFGIRHSSLDVNAGRLSVGPKVGYAYTTVDGSLVKPWVGVRGEYDFSNQGAVPASGLPDLDDVLSARLSLGVDAVTVSNMRITAQGDVSGLGSGEYTAYGASARIDVPF
jgi:outer membrane autotransporter protein